MFSLRLALAWLSPAPPAITNVRGDGPYLVCGLPLTRGLRFFAEPLECLLQRSLPSAWFDVDAPMTQRVSSPASVTDPRLPNDPLGEVSVSHHPKCQQCRLHPRDMSGQGKEAFPFRGRPLRAGGPPPPLNEAARTQQKPKACAESPPWSTRTGCTIMPAPAESCGRPHMGVESAKTADCAEASELRSANAPFSRA